MLIFQKKAGIGSNANAWDLDFATYENKSLGYTPNLAQTQSLFFKPDGTTAYFGGVNLFGVNSDDGILQYTLSIPWDITTASYDSKMVDTNNKTSVLADIFISPDGVNVYIMGDSSDTIYHYIMSTPWNISTATYSAEKDVSSENTLPFGVHFKPDGTKAYVGDRTSKAVYQYTLSTPWLLSSMSYDSVSTSISEVVNLMDLEFSPDGLNMYTLDFTPDIIRHYSLSSAWDLATASLTTESLDVTAQETSPQAIAFSATGDKVYVSGLLTLSVLQYAIE